MIDDQTKEYLAEVMADLQRLRQKADQAFARVLKAHPREVACHRGCDDCCHAMFDLAPVEALAIARAFADLPRAERRSAARRAEKASRAFDQAAALAMAAQGDQRMKVLSRARIACPLLEKGACLLYGQRPLTCRLYGIPVAIEGQPRTCHLARFREGETYPTVDLGVVLQQVDELSRRVCRLWPELDQGRLDMGRVLKLADELAADLKVKLP